MAKITTITNPLTGQPAQVDQLDHTAQEIDDAIARALPGGAIDTALQNKAEKVEAQELKLFGYISPVLPNGVKNYIEGNVFHKRVGRVDLGTLNWTYKSDLNYFDAPYNDVVTSPNDGIVYAICSRYAWGNVRDASSDKVFSTVGFSYYHQINVKDTDYTTVEAFKAAVSGVYVYYQKATEETYSILDCDWSMPPMELGIEYRTTERYMGKPVYTMAINTKAIGLGVVDDYPHGIANVDDIWVCGGSFIESGTNKYSIPFFGGASGNHVIASANRHAVHRINSSNVYVITDMTVILKYTKLTDD